MPDPFITLTDLTDILGITVTSDPGATIAIDAACDICRDIAERDFNAGTATITLDGSGTDALLIPNRYLPVTAVGGTATVNGEEETEFVLGSSGVLFRGTAGADPRPVWPSGRQNVSVTFTHGYETADFPRSVKMAALQIAERLVVQGVAAEETSGDVRTKYSTAATDLTNGERMILAKYRGIR